MQKSLDNVIKSAQTPSLFINHSLMETHCIYLNNKLFYLSICPFISLSVYLSIYLTIFLRVWIFIYISICLSVCLYICLSICMGICLSVNPSVCLPISLSVSLCASLSIYLSVWLFDEFYIYCVGILLYFFKCLKK